MSLEDVVKRGVDILGSASALILLSPLYVVISASICFIDGPPILYRQLRYGRDSKVFVLYKFKTFQEGYPDMSRAFVGGKGIEPQYTRTGRFLRGTKLNELPNFWNCLVGDMSLVGPRPAIYAADEGDSFDLELQKAREREGISRVRPGITGFTQLSGMELPVDKRVELDRKYLSPQFGVLEYFRLLAKTMSYVARSCFYRVPEDNRPSDA